MVLILLTCECKEILILHLQTSVNRTWVNEFSRSLHSSAHWQLSQLNAAIRCCTSLTEFPLDFEFLQKKNKGSPQVQEALPLQVAQGWEGDLSWPSSVWCPSFDISKNLSFLYSSSSISHIFPPKGMLSQFKYLKIWQLPNCWHCPPW